MLEIVGEAEELEFDEAGNLSGVSAEVGKAGALSH